MFRSKKSIVASLAISAVILAACGSGSSSSSSATTAAASATTSTAAPTKVTIALPVAEPVQSPVYLAKIKGYFQKEGIDPKIVVLAGDVIVNSALVSNSVQFTSVNAVSLLTANSKGIPIQMACMEYDGPEWAMAVTNQIATSAGLSSSSSPKAVLEALKGDKVAAVGGPAAAPGVMLLGLLAHYNLPSNLFTIFAVQSSSALVTSLQHNEVQAIFDTQPIPAEAQKLNAGKVVFDTTEIPSLASVPWEGIVAAKSYIASHAKIVKGVCKAISQADNYLISNPSAATTDLQPTFAKLSPSLLKSALVSYKWVKDAQMTASQWTNGLAALESFHLLSKPISSSVLSKSYTTADLPSSSAG
ncbi:MAG: ABC transporter substrate-binding protein [Actinobacteria bacterium]|nr:ABC transporter substrate-binding protein [Actinomycetota bacterium]